MGKLMIGLILVICLNTTSLCFEYTDWPHHVTSEAGGSATFNWRLDQSLDTIGWTNIFFQFDNRPIGNIVANPFQVIYEDEYQGRATLADPRGKHIVGFTLSGETAADAGGPYSCDIKVRAQGNENNNASLLVLGPPTTPAITPSPYSAVENDTFTLTCFADHTSVPADLVPDITYSWTRDGLAPADRHTVTGSHGQHLTVQPVTRDDHQETYTCQAREADRTSSKAIHMTVFYGPNAIFLTDPGPITVTEGEPVSVTCQTDCSPRCSFRWTRSADPSWSDEDAVLNLPNIDREFHDNFVCSASNTYGLQRVILQINVHFPSQIIEFLPSPADKLSHGQTVSLICSVESRPGSVITFSNSSTELSRESGHQAQYQFPAISVLDSGDYRCSAQNGIPPNPSDVANKLDVKGGFHNCANQSDTVLLGVELGVAVVVTICQFANPFTEISRNNWVFDPINTTSTKSDLPEDVTIFVEPTEHEYMNIIHFNVPAVTHGHLGEYTMTNQNTEGEALIVTLRITPEGPPETPHSFMCTRTTAVSIDLQWISGFDGGFCQTFMLNFSGGNVSGSDESEARCKTEGDLVTHKLEEKHGIIPEQTFVIQLNAQNEKGYMIGPSVINSTKVRPEFIGKEPEIQIEDTKAYITWAVLHPGSVSSIDCDACNMDRGTDCQSTNITDPNTQPYEVVVPEATDFIFTFCMYDGIDKVNRYTYEHYHEYGASGASSQLTIIVGAVVGVVVAAALVVLFVMLWRKGIFAKDHASKSEQAVHYENVTDVIVGGNKQENKKTTDVQYEDIGDLAFSPVGTDTKVYEGLIGGEINNAPVVYEAYGGEKTEVVQYRPSDIRPRDVINRGAVFCVQAAVILSEKHTEKARNIVTKQIVATDAELLKGYLLEAARVLSRVGRCPHVVSCAGVAGGSLLMENVLLGNLRQYLRGMADHAYANTADVIQKECLGFVRQIVKGLEAVVSIAPIPLFYCLSTDHVLLGQGQICKLTGFNTAESVRQSEQWDQEQGKFRPVRWLAPEAIDLGHIPESDIWAFGVLVWEILNFGIQPYPDIEDSQIVDFLKRRHRHLEMSPSTKAEICDLVNQCWMLVPSKRPAHTQISEVVNEVIPTR